MERTPLFNRQPELSAGQTKKGLPRGVGSPRNPPGYQVRGRDARGRRSIAIRKNTFRCEKIFLPCGAVMDDRRAMKKALQKESHIRQMGEVAICTVTGHGFALIGVTRARVSHLFL